MILSKHVSDVYWSEIIQRQLEDCNIIYNQLAVSMRQKPHNHNNQIPSFMELQNMLKNLKLTEIKENIETQRFHTDTEQPPFFEQQNKNITSQYTSIIFDNFEDPNCFQEQIKAIDIDTLKRNIEKKPILVEEKHGEGIVQKFKLYMETQAQQKKQKCQTKIKKKLVQNQDNNQNFPQTAKSVNKSPSTLNLTRQNNHNKENKKIEVNKPKLFSKDPQEIPKKKIFSNIQMHKFSDCQQLLRGTHKK